MSDTVQTPADAFAGLPPAFAEICALPKWYASRFDLDRPFAAAGHIHASDGFLLVRLPLAGLSSRPEWAEGRQPQTPALWPGWEAAAGPEAPLPDPETMAACSACNGKGRLECFECDGEGLVRCNYDHTHDCPRCGGEGEKSCPGCKGDGKAPAEVGGCRFRAGYVSILWRAGFRSLRVPPDDSKPAVLRAGDLEAAVMPIGKAKGVSGE